MRYGRTAIRGKRKRRMKFRACGPSLPTRFDLMAVPLKAAHSRFCYALAQKKTARSEKGRTYSVKTRINLPVSAEDEGSFRVSDLSQKGFTVTDSPGIAPDSTFRSKRRMKTPYIYLMGL